MCANWYYRKSTLVHLKQKFATVAQNEVKLHGCFTCQWSLLFPYWLDWLKMSRFALQCQMAFRRISVKQQIFQSVEPCQITRRNRMLRYLCWDPSRITQRNRLRMIRPLHQDVPRIISLRDLALCRYSWSKTGTNIQSDFEALYISLALVSTDVQL